MRAGGGKQKGASFERKVCVDLSLWISKGADKGLFWRSSMSGGRSTVAMKKGDKLASQAGDISAVHEMGHKLVNEFYVECKTYKTLNLESFIKGKGKLIDFWKHAVKDAKQYGKEPILVAKQNLYPTMAVMTAAGVGRLSMKGLVKIKVTLDDGPAMFIVLWDEFLNRDPRKLLRVRL